MPAKPTSPREVSSSTPANWRGDAQRAEQTAPSPRPGSRPARRSRRPAAAPSPAAARAPSSPATGAPDRVPCRAAPSSDPCRRRRRPCSDGPLRAAPTARPRGPRRPTSPTAASHGRGSVTSPGRRVRAALRSPPGARERRAAHVIARLKCGSSTHTGRASESGTKRTTGGNAAPAAAWLSTIARTSANGGGGPSKMLTPPTCIGLVSLSM